MNNKHKLVRMTKVLSMALIIFVQIYWYKLRKKPEAEWEILWEKIGSRFRRTLFELEGLLIKIGQILSIRTDFLPNAFIEQIKDLTDKVPPSEWSHIKKIIETEWGSPIGQHLQSIEENAIASASIGEVYRGVLKDGTVVAVKVQRPYIRSIIGIDFRILSIIIWFADHFLPIPNGFINLKVLFKELKQVIERERDFTKEQKALLFFKERFKDIDILKVPDVYTELCTPKVMVMEWVEGIRFTDVESIANVSVSRKELAQRLLTVFLPQWLEPGMFHADPHPGNILVSKEGKIILLDFGMVGEISKRDSSHFQDLIKSFLSKDYAKTVECLAHLGFLLDEGESRTIERLLAEYVTIQPSDLKDMDLIALKMEMNDMIQALPIQVPTRFVFLGRSFVTIEGILHELVQEDELIDIAKPVFLEWLSKQENSKWSFVWMWLQSHPLFKIFHSASEFLKTPQTLERLKETEQRRQFQFTILENNKRHLFQLMLLGLGGLGASIYLSHPLLWKISTGVTIFSIAGYFISHYNLKKWMKYMAKKRR